MTLSLHGKTAIVTGGTTGIGAAIGKAFVDAGANVVLDYVVNPEQATAYAAELARGNDRCIAVHGDVTSVADLQGLVDAAVSRFGGLDIWVNNAGVETRESLLETSEKHYDWLMAVNLRGSYFGTQLAAKQFIKTGTKGVILNISSTHEDWPMPGNLAYCVSKGGMQMLTRTAAVELGKHGIRIVSIAPGAIDTPINDETEADAAKMKALNDAIPLGYMGQPEQIGSVAAFLASDAASYITATTVVADGGLMQTSLGL